MDKNIQKNDLKQKEIIIEESTNANLVSEVNSVDNVILHPEINENQIQKDMQNGNEIVLESSKQMDWVVIDKVELTLDEQFIEARKIAHKHEHNVSKIKKSTLKKRRAEYERKKAEREKMLSVRDQLNESKNGEMRNSLKTLFEGLAEKAGDSLADVPENIKENAISIVMFFQKKEGLSVEDMNTMYHDLCYDVSKTEDVRLKDMDKSDIEKFNLKMCYYEKMFNEALSWNIDDFNFKDNHALANDPKLLEKMEKLSMVSSIKSALTEYINTINDDRMKNIRKDSQKSILPNELITELQVRLAVYEDIHNEMQTRIDLVSNKYYTLLGKSDTSKMDMNTLKLESKMETSTSKDPEMAAYFDAISRTQEIKQTGSELKGKKLSTYLDRIKKINNIPTGKKANAATQERIKDYNIAYLTSSKNILRYHNKEAIKKGDTSVNRIEFTNGITNLQIDAIYKDLGIELTKEKKEAILANNKDRLKDSKHAAGLIDNHRKRREELRKELEGRLFKEFFRGYKTELREEHTGILEYLLSPEFQTKDGKEKQYKIFRTFMLPYLDRSFHSPIKEKEDTNNIIIQVFRDALKDDQIAILSKYKTPKEFATKATQEDFDKLVQLRHIGGWVNQLIFEHKNKDIISLIDNTQEYKDLYVKLKYAAYEFAGGVMAEVELMGNINYAFMDDETIENIKTTNPTNHSLEAIKNSKTKLDNEKGNYRIGENAAKRMEADAKKFDSDPTLWAEYAKNHKEDHTLYTKGFPISFYTPVVKSSLELLKYANKSDSELQKEKETIENNIFKIHKKMAINIDTVSDNYIKKINTLKAHYSDKEKEIVKKDITEIKMVDGALSILEKKIQSLMDKFRENGSTFKNASPNLLNEFKKVNIEINDILDKGDIFLLDSIMQNKIWIMVADVRPVLNYAKEAEEEEQIEDEDYIKLTFEDAVEDFESEFPNLKKETLEKAKEKDPQLKAWLEIKEEEQDVQNQTMKLDEIDYVISEREKNKKEKDLSRSDAIQQVLLVKNKEMSDMQFKVEPKIRNTHYLTIYNNSISMINKYMGILEDIKDLDEDVLTKELIQDIKKDFDFFRMVIENDNRFIFSMSDTMADMLWNIYSVLAPIAEYDQKIEGNPDMKAISEHQKNHKIKVNREDAENLYRGKLFFNEKERDTYDYMKTNFEFVELVTLKKEIATD